MDFHVIKGLVIDICLFLTIPCNVELQIFKIIFFRWVMILHCKSGSEGSDFVPDSSWTRGNFSEIHTFVTKLPFDSLKNNKVFPIALLILNFKILSDYEKNPQRTLRNPQWTWGKSSVNMEKILSEYGENPQWTWGKSSVNMGKIIC